MSGSDAYFGAPVVTGEAVALELRPAGVATRGLAFLIDFLAESAAFFVLQLALIRFAFDTNVAALEAIFISLYVLVYLGYPVLFETLTRGRTLGKMALGLRVVRDDGGPIRFRHALLRGLVGVVIEKPGLSLGTFALITMLISRSGKRLGDMAAGTFVLQERVPARLGALPDMPPALAGWASGLDLSGVGDDLALRVRQFLARAHELDPNAREHIGSALVAEVASRTSAPIPPGVPGWAYLAAVLAERRSREMSRVATPPTPGPAPTWQPPPPPAVAQPAERTGTDGFTPPA